MCPPTPFVGQVSYAIWAGPLPARDRPAGGRLDLPMETKRADWCCEANAAASRCSRRPERQGVDTGSRRSRAHDGETANGIVVVHRSLLQPGGPEASETALVRSHARPAAAGRVPIFRCRDGRSLRGEATKAVVHGFRFSSCCANYRAGPPCPRAMYRVKGGCADKWRRRCSDFNGQGSRLASNHRIGVCVNGG